VYRIVEFQKTRFFLFKANAFTFPNRLLFENNTFFCWEFEKDLFIIRLDSWFTDRNWFFCDLEVLTWKYFSFPIFPVSFPVCWKWLTRSAFKHACRFRLNFRFRNALPEKLDLSFSMSYFFIILSVLDYW